MDGATFSARVQENLKNLKKIEKLVYGTADRPGGSAHVAAYIGKVKFLGFRQSVIYTAPADPTDTETFHMDTFEPTTGVEGQTRTLPTRMGQLVIRPESATLDGAQIVNEG